MRTLLLLLVVIGWLTPGHAAEARRGRVIKVLPVFLDQQGRDANTPSLFGRDAYQAYLREHTNEVSALRFAVQWQAKRDGPQPIEIFVEMRGVGENGLPKLKAIKAEVTPKRFSQWTYLTLADEDYHSFGAVVAWRVTLWEGEALLSEQKSFLW
jgi:hypothetical protein